MVIYRAEHFLSQPLVNEMLSARHVLKEEHRSGADMAGMAAQAPVPAFSLAPLPFVRSTPPLFSVSR